MSFITLAEMGSREVVPGFHGKFIHSENVTVSFWDIEQDAVLPEHAHEHEQFSVVLEGKLELTVGGETRVLEPGLVAVIPGNVPHSGRAITPCRVCDVFYPVREDYR
ncbi:MAG: cupin domain-containing protein [Chloroflexi bacterium]|nr:cupin domain-containing protein [Chloroflexota bacterium]